jgi:serine/threonine-protein kinase RIO1
MEYQIIRSDDVDITENEFYNTTAYEGDSETELELYASRNVNYDPLYRNLQDIAKLFDEFDGKFVYAFQPGWEKRLRPQPRKKMPKNLPPIHVAFDLANKFFYDPHVMHNAMYQIMLLNRKNVTSKQILEVVTYSGKKIGDENAKSGKVYLSGISNDQDHIDYLKAILATNSNEELVKIVEKSNACFAVKTITDPINFEEASHECVIGMELNQLRAMNCPYFMYTYGLYDCGSITFHKKKVTNICGERGQSKYLFLENISNAISMDDVFQDRSREKYYIPYLLCIAYALQVAYNKTGFVHGDLHGANLLLRDKDTIMHLPIEDLEGNIVYIECMGCPTIIDFGQASTLKNPMTTHSLYDKYTPVHTYLRFILSLTEIRDIGLQQSPASVREILDELNLNIIFNGYQISGNVIMTRSLGTIINYIFTEYPEIVVQNEHRVHLMTSDSKQTITMEHHRELNLSDLITHSNVSAHQKQMSLDNERVIIGLTEQIIEKLSKRVNRGGHQVQLGVSGSLLEYMKSDLKSRQQMIDRVTSGSH